MFGLSSDAIVVAGIPVLGFLLGYMENISERVRRDSVVDLVIKVAGSIVLYACWSVALAALASWLGVRDVTAFWVGASACAFALGELFIATAIGNVMASGKRQGLGKLGGILLLIGASLFIVCLVAR